MTGLIDLTNFLVNLLIVSAITGIIVLLLKLFKNLFKNRYTCFIKQLIWIVLAIRLIVPISYSNTFFKLNTDVYDKSDVVTFKVESMNEGIYDNIQYVAPLRNDSVPETLGDKCNKTTEQILNDDYYNSNEILAQRQLTYLNPSRKSQKEEITQLMADYVNERWDDVYFKNRPMYYVYMAGMKLEYYGIKLMNFLYRNVKAFVGIYATGVFLYIAYQLVLFGVLYQKKERNSIIISDDRYLNILSQVVSELKIKHMPTLRFMKEIDSPMAVKFFKHDILLPKTDSLNDYSDDELRMIYMHELMHIKHHDIEVKWLYLLANALHWFNPLIYIMVKDASNDMELYCDYSVVEKFDEEKRKDYNQVLLDLLKQNSKRNGYSVLTTHFNGSVAIMKERFSSNLDMRIKKDGIIPVILLIVVIILSAGIFSVESNYFTVEYGFDSFWTGNVNDKEESEFNDAAEEKYSGSWQDLETEIYNEKNGIVNYSELFDGYISYFKAGAPTLPLQPYLQENGKWIIPIHCSDANGSVTVEWRAEKKTDIKPMEAPPEISISCYETAKNITTDISNYGVLLNHWDTKSDTFVPAYSKENSDADSFFARQAKDDIPAFDVTNWTTYNGNFYIKFPEGMAPDYANVEDTVLSEDGSVRYLGNQFEIIYRPVDIIFDSMDNNSISLAFPLSDHYSIGEYEHNVEDTEQIKPLNRGYRLTCYWNTSDGMQSCTYYFMVKTQKNYLE